MSQIKIKTLNGDDYEKKQNIEFISEVNKF